MKVDELKNIWNQSNDKQREVFSSLLKEVTKQKTNNSLWEFRFNYIVELVVNIVFLPFFVGFTIDHWGDLKFFIPGLIISAVVLFSITLAAYKIHLDQRLKETLTISQHQTILSKIQILDKRSIRSLLWLIPLLSNPFLVVFGKAFFNWDLYQYGSWMIIQAVGSILIAFFLVFILQKYPNKQIQESLDFLNQIELLEKE